MAEPFYLSVSFYGEIQFCETRRIFFRMQLNRLNNLPENRNLPSLILQLTG